MKVKLVCFDFKKVASILSACRSEGTTLTGLVHGAVVTAFALLVPEAKNLQGHTPYSMRAYTGTSALDSMVNQTSDSGCFYNEDLLNAIRSSNIQDRFDHGQTWDAARHFSKNMAKELEQVPQDNDLATLLWLADIRKM